jgi:sugar O-acyltransferase (sialic acid O-acetyltransferase NeuD family)
MGNISKHAAPLVIFGVGGLAREIFGWIRASKRDSRAYPIAAFVVDDAGEQGEYCGVPVVGREYFGHGAARPRFIMAVSEPKAKARVCGELEAAGWSAAQYVHESVLIGTNVKVGRGMIACPLCTISSDAVIGDHVLINGSTLVGHDVRIGDFCSLLGRVSLNGGVILGEGVLVGASATIYPGKKVGAGAIIGMGGVVFRNVAAGVTVAGNPASRLSA